jgi:tetratricopeptide (TPR) repeat protein
LPEAIAHAGQAVSLLQETEDKLWLSQALFTSSYCCFFAGDFDAALAAASRLQAFGDGTGIRRAQASAALLTGLSRAARKDGDDDGIAACERALDLSPDEFETAFALAALGRAYWEAGEATRAAAVLERAVDLADRVRSLQFRAWFRTMLAEAYLSLGEVDKSHAVVTAALQASTTADFLIGTGLAQYVLGRIALGRGALADAQRDLEAALSAFACVGAQFEQARTHLELAIVAQKQAHGDAASRNLDAARSLFVALRLFQHAERAEHLHESLGPTLIA